MTVDREKLKADITSMATLSQKDLKGLEKEKHFATRVYESVELEPDKIQPVLIPTDSTQSNWGDWQAIAENVASFQFRRSPGRNCYFLVKNQYDGRNLGILDLGADFLSLEPRDKHIG